MQNVHPQQPKFEPLVLPEGIKAKPVESEIVITQEKLEIPVPKRSSEADKDATITKHIKRELSETQALEELARTDESHTFAFQSTRANPQSAVTAIRHRIKPSVASQVASAIVLEDVETEDKSVESTKSKSDEHTS